MTASMSGCCPTIPAAASGGPPAARPPAGRGHRPGRLRGWLAKIDQLAKDGQPLGDSVRRLAEQARTWLIPNAEQRLAALTDTPTRSGSAGPARLETSLQVRQGSRLPLPARYLGTQAAASRSPRAVGATPRPRGGTHPQRPHGQGPGRREEPLWVRPRSGDHPRARLAPGRPPTARRRPTPLRARRGRGDRPEPDRER